jgi:hypothetical protein
MRNIEIVLKPDHPDTLSVTNVGLIESMPVSPVDPPSGRLHPVVAELRIMRDQLGGLTKSLVIAFYIFIALWVLLQIFR